MGANSYEHLDSPSFKMLECATGANDCDIFLFDIPFVTSLGYYFFFYVLSHKIFMYFFLWFVNYAQQLNFDWHLGNFYFVLVGGRYFGFRRC